ncbi:MAG: chorismate synthase [Oscillospiraceae bacterium]|jgi:chorismate synthase|nr:chorismate synthase [Oscillospiraceae bacterium]
MGGTGMLSYTIFGESHGPAIGVTLTGVPPGLAMDEGFIAAEMARRAPGNSPLSTARREADVPRILSGVFEGRTTGAPLCAVIENTNTRSGDYADLRVCPRPSHGDYAGFVASKGCLDYRGGGHFSGRLTAPLVFAGAVAKLLLRECGVSVSACISMAGGVKDPSPEELEAVILAAKRDQDSVGGTIACAVTGLPPGLGAPDIDCNVEGIFARHLFAVPAVKGVAFGAGFALARMRGSEANDPFYMDGGTVRTRTNHAGGVNGGITNGMPVTFEVVIRPTPSIAKEQDSVNLTTGEDCKLTIHGRHDPCILPRAVVVVEAAAALAACEVWGGGAANAR